ncbi:membrane protein [Streptomyces sp. 1114.5]|uniref:YhjD/YihY/BrkB family envelope integrity protein n=1 Tax=unclassified Streptomyces TaxID=2593676 RepID=UPI000BC64ED4|nr:MULTISPECIES: YhjD/YihY/BrkB family envelope integrity protein [unclassified Streptomyces]RKT19499.1 membrane protein [Streptomyces sp. 1114.5]SOB85695.1 membrane protein [Streptomyces sp. 1331.2]
MAQQRGEPTRTDRFRARSAWLRGRTADLRDAPFLRRLAAQLIHIHVLDTATRLAAQAFLTAIPVLFVLAAFLPQEARSSAADSLRTVLGLQGSSLDDVKRALQPVGREATTDAFGGIGILVTVLSATSCSRILQRLCERTWHLPHLSGRLAAWRWLAWLLVWIVALVLQGKVRSGFGAGEALGVVLYLITAGLLWLWTQHLLLGGRVSWLPLIPGAVLTSAGLTALAWVSKLYVPRSLNRSITQFGPLGLVFTLLSWLIVVFTAVTLGIGIGYVVAGQGRLARLLGTPEPTGEDDG